MLSIVFSSLAILAIWTGITLLKKGPNEVKIKALLKEMGANTLKLFDILISLFSNCKSLFLMLSDPKNEELSKKADTQVPLDSILETPKLIKLEKIEEKDVA